MKSNTDWYAFKILESVTYHNVLLFRTSCKTMAYSQNLLYKMENFDGTSVSKSQLKEINRLKIRNIPINDVKKLSISAANFHYWLLYNTNIASKIHIVLAGVDVLLKRKTDW